MIVKHLYNLFPSCWREKIAAQYDIYRNRISGNNVTVMMDAIMTMMVTSVEKNMGWMADRWTLRRKAGYCAERRVIVSVDSGWIDITCRGMLLFLWRKKCETMCAMSKREQLWYEQVDKQYNGRIILDVRRNAVRCYWQRGHSETGCSFSPFILVRILVARPSHRIRLNNESKVLWLRPDVLQVIEMEWEAAPILSY